MSLTKDQWFENPELRPALAELLQNPTLRAALEIVRDMELLPINFPGNGDLTQYYALMGARRTGYLEALKNLYALSTITKAKQKELRPWDSTLPPQKV